MIAVDSSSSVPPFEQIRRQVAARVDDGTMPVGTRLPPVRQLAAELGLAVNTVARAYRELERAGLIETRGRAGSFVCATGDERRARARAAADHYAAEAAALGLEVDEAVAIVRAALESPAQR